MTTPDTRIVRRGLEVGEVSEPIVDHPGQPRDYFHADGTVWTWQDSWRKVGGVDLRVYDLVTRIMLRKTGRETGGPETDALNYPIVDHPGQPADYVHMDGTVWTWQARRWRPLGGGRYLRVYDLVEPATDSD